jgi:diguanylate cyclase (GGDEF)-like protein
VRDISLPKSITLLEHRQKATSPCTNATFLTFLKWPICCILLFTCVHNTWASEEKSQLANALMVSEDILQKLTLADNNRLSDPQHFQQLLSELSHQKADFTPAHHHFFNYLQGYHFTYIGEHQKAEQVLTELLQSNTSHLLKFRANYTLINLSAINHKWANGLQYIADNNEMIKNIKDERLIQSSLLASTLFYTSLKQYDLALNLINKLEQYNLSPHQQCFATLYTLRAKFYLGRLNLNSVEIPETIKLCLNADNKIGVNSARSYQARLYLLSQKPQKALNLLLPYLEDVESTRLPMLIASVNNLIAQAYYQLNNMDQAKHFATKAMLLNKYNSGVQRARDSYKVLYQVAEKQKNLALALSHYKQFSQLDKAFLDEVKTKHLAFQLAEHTHLEQMSEIKLLNEKNTLLITKQNLAETKLRNVQLGITVLILLLSIFAVWGARLWRAHKRIKVLSESDELTGIHNRRHFNYVAASALRYCKTAKQSLSVVMFDLDHFKRINDNFGHDCGDWALKETITACQAIGKNSDVFSRLGGEEFCLLLPSCNIDEAFIRAEACRVSIENIVTEASGSDFSITASFGVTDITRSGFRLSDLLKDADKAMYVSKKAGRNQVTLFKPKEVKDKKLDNSWSLTF